MDAKLESIQKLTFRNKFNQDNPHISFPFSIVEPSDEKRTYLSIKMQSDLKKTLLISNKQMKIYGDLEIISCIPTIFNTELESPNN